MTVILFSLMIYITGMISMYQMRKHVLSFLLCLEFLMLSLFLMLMYLAHIGLYLLVCFFLIMVVCEACLGMGLMVLMVYYYGSDLMNSYSLMNM